MHNMNLKKRTKSLCFSKNRSKKKKLKKNGFSLIELVIVILILIILAAISIPSFLNLIEKAEVEVAKRNLLDAFLECQIKIAEGETNPRYTIPPNTNKFQYPDSGTDGECLSPSSGNILTAARTAYGQSVSDYNLNINVVTGEKSTERNVPNNITWE